jgi:hypothetical protein
MSKPKWLAVGNIFLEPYWAPEVEILHCPVEDMPATIAANPDLLCLWSMNTGAWGNPQELPRAVAIARAAGLPTVWQTIEDPNGWAGFVAEAKQFDFVFTSAAECVERYKAAGIPNVFWLPMACQPAIHQPQVLLKSACDLVFIGNHYPYPERVEFLERVLLPLLRAGMTLALYSYANSPWPPEVCQHWRGETSCYDVAQYYRDGRIALGANCQGRNTWMTSMRTYEALACGKPLLAYHSDAYERLGFVNGRHFLWTNETAQAVFLGRLMQETPVETALMADQGREFVLRHHTYAKRLEYLRYVLAGGREQLRFVVQTNGG